MAELEDLQNTTNLEKDVRDIIGIKKLSDIKSKTEVSEKISTLVQFIVDEYGIFFDDKDEDAIEDQVFSLELLVSLSDGEYDTTDEIIKSIIRINQVVEEEDFLDDEIVVNIKTILVYMLDILQDEPEKVN
jgi:hypothetical protein|tara:strand:+ start:102 stop:494 length:393 start_codon:yes stop_codon:yes gene_type:complete